MAQEDVASGLYPDENGDEALRQIENELAVVEEAMAQRQRSLVEVDQRLNDLQASGGCSSALVRPALDPVAEAAAAEESIAPPLRAGVDPSCGMAAAPVANGAASSGSADHGFQQEIFEDPSRPQPSSGSSDNLQNASLKAPPLIAAPRSQDNGSYSESSSPGRRPLTAPGSHNVAHMYSVPTRTDASPRQTPLVMSGSQRGMHSRGSSSPEVVVAQVAVGSRKVVPTGSGRTTLFGYSAATASTSPWRQTPRSSALPLQKVNGSSDSLSLGPNQIPASPRGSSVPVEARRIFPVPSGQAQMDMYEASAASPSVGTPRGYDSITAGVRGSTTPRVPLQAVRATGSGYQAISGPLISGPRGHQVDSSSRARSISAGPANAGNPLPTGALTPRPLMATPFTQYGNRFSAVPTNAAGVPIRSSSRNPTPQPVASGRFVPVSGPGYMEARGRESSIGPSRALSASARGGSQTPNVLMAGNSAVVRQSSVQRPAVVRQVSGPASSLGSCTPGIGASIQTAGGSASTSAAAMEDPPPALLGPVRGQGAPHVAQALSAAATAARGLQSNQQRQGQGQGPSISTSGTPQQPSRYAYANAAAVRRAAQPEPRDSRRRGRV